MKSYEGRCLGADGNAGGRHAVKGLFDVLLFDAGQFHYVRKVAEELLFLLALVLVFLLRRV